MHEDRKIVSSRLAKGARSLGLGLGFGVIFALASIHAGFSQGPPRDIINRPPPMPTDPDSVHQMDPTEMERRLNALNNERQKQLVSDTNKLLKLARELNDAVAMNAYNTLNPDQVHKLAQIEKLARSVKEAMSEAVGPPQPTTEVPLPLPPH